MIGFSGFYQQKYKIKNLLELKWKLIEKSKVNQSHNNIEFLVKIGQKWIKIKQKWLKNNNGLSRIGKFLAFDSLEDLNLNLIFPKHSVLYLTVLKNIMFLFIWQYSVKTCNNFVDFLQFLWIFSIFNQLSCDFQAWMPYSSDSFDALWGSSGTKYKTVEKWHEPQKGSQFWPLLTL